MSESKEYSLKELLDKLPSSYSELTLEQYKKIGGLSITDESGEDEMFNGYENSYELVGALLDISPEAIKSLPMYITNQLCEKVSFTVKPIEPLTSTKYQWKDINEIKTADWWMMLNFGNDIFANSHYIVKAFCKDSLTDEEINKMPIDEAVTGFFLLGLNTRKLLNNSRNTLIKQIMKLMVREKIMKMKQRIKKLLKK